MIIRKSRVEKEIEYLELKEKESLKTLRDKIFRFGKGLGIELTDDMIEEFQGIMNLNSYHRNFNKEKNILILKKSFTLKIMLMLFTSKIINWFKKLFITKNTE